MDEKPIRNDRAEIYCRAETKEEIRALKRGDDTFDELLDRMVGQYDPEASREMEGGGDGV